ncbi:MAG: indole-3-glycerol phosphate synthase TrpC [Candidatus Omnitrophota bacterium]|jgi:indole-3-glycerol phosphate synthase|nr:MAG: indole-3-glycerol phosphate synthase TrpC [Candidatus Omnitrophota bacterium]
MKDTLKEIIKVKKEKLLLAKQALPEDELKSRLTGLPEARGFTQAIAKPKQISLIAELKKASPSKGLIRQDFDIAKLAAAYQEAGAQAISVLTEEDFFQGNLSYLQIARDNANLPVLRKDFIMEAYQIYESRVFGADAVLLIADILSKDKLVELMGISKELGLDCLVEVHDEKELKKVLNLKVPLIGINNRDLHSLEVDFKITEKLFPLIPKEKIVVVESGIKTYQDILFLKILGASAVLIGEAIMSSQDVRQKIEEIMGW